MVIMVVIPPLIPYLAIERIVVLWCNTAYMVYTYILY